MLIEELNETLLPSAVALAEAMGIVVVVCSLLKGFWEYVMNALFHKHYNLQMDLPNGLATALSFMMAAEILKTIVVSHFQDLLTLGAIILLRMALTLMIHFETKGRHASEAALEEEEAEAEAGETAPAPSADAAE